MGLLILGVVALSTMILEMVGPISVKRSLCGAGELPEDYTLFEPDEVRLFDIDKGSRRTNSEDVTTQSGIDDETES